MVYWNVSFLVAVLIEGLHSAVLLTMALGLSGCAIKGKVPREKGFSPLKGVWDHHADGAQLRT